VHTLVESGLLEVGNIKIRPLTLKNYLKEGKIAPFIHTTVRILKARSDEQTQKLITQY
jgi:5-carboxymethyl-2-hydroxymuconate isomerase